MSSSVLKIPTAEVFEPLLAPARYKGAHGGRGSGKSHFFAGLAVEDALAFPGVSGTGLRMVCIREVQKSLKHSAKSLIEAKLRDFGLGEADGFKVWREVIETPGDGLIIFQGMQDHTADSIKSLEEFHRAWVEEAQSLSSRSLQLLRPTIRWEDERLGIESELWFGWNPRAPGDPVDAMLRGEAAPTGSAVVRANWSDNPWFPSVLEQERLDCLRTSPDQYDHTWEGGYETASEARVFRNWRVEEFDTPRDSVHRFGADWGFSVDPSVLIRCHVQGRTLYVDHEAWEVGCEIDRLPQLFGAIEGARKWTIRADGARPETISYMRRHGFPRIVKAIKGPGSIEDGVEFLRSFDIVVHPRCKNVAQELARYSYKTDPHTGEVLPVLEDKDNHTIDALRYALEELRRSGYRPRDGARQPRPMDDYEIDDGEADNWKVA